jgi:hypothetical protein
MELQFHPGPARKLSSNRTIYISAKRTGQGNSPKHVEMHPLAEINLGN